MKYDVISTNTWLDGLDDDTKQSMISLAREIVDATIRGGKFIRSGREVAANALLFTEGSEYPLVVTTDILKRYEAFEVIDHVDHSQFILKDEPVFDADRLRQLERDAKASLSVHLYCE